MLSILVVDDDPMICKTMSDVIRLKGYHCDTAYGGGPVSYTHLTLPTNREV